MKHIFYTHSHITYLVSLQTIEFEKLDKQHCVILYGRNFKPDLESLHIKSLDFPFSYYPVDSFPFFGKFWKGRKRLAQLDIFLEQVTDGDNFLFYVPQSYMKPFKLVASNKKCIGYSYIEEGLGVYHTQKEMSVYFLPRKRKLKAYLKSLLNYGLRLSRTDYFFEKSYKHVYGISEDAFPDFPRKKVVGLPVLSSAPNYEFDTVLVFDAIIETGFINKATLAYALLLLIAHFKEKGISTVYYKFHPVQLQADISPGVIRTIFDEHNAGIEFQEIDQTISLERIAFSTTATFYIIISSIGLYAALYNRKVYSMVNYIAELEPEFKQRYNALPLALRSRVELL